MQMKMKLSASSTVMKLLIYGLILGNLSCNSSSGSDPQPTATVCGRLEWSNTLGDKGYFTGTAGSRRFDLVAAESDGQLISFQHDPSGHIRNTNPDFSFTYDGDNVYSIESPTNGGTFIFDKQERLSRFNVSTNDGKDADQSSATYTYDGNDDPVTIKVHDTSQNLSTGKTSSGDTEITADYLTDKPAFYQLVPEMTLFTPNFAYIFYTSKHLINKWQIHITGVDEDGKAISPINFTQQYTYTYDNDGRVATMVHTGNSKNTFTFVYSECK